MRHIELNGYPRLQALAASTRCYPYIDIINCHPLVDYSNALFDVFESYVELCDLRILLIRLLYVKIKGFKLYEGSFTRIHRQF